MSKMNRTTLAFLLALSGSCGQIAEVDVYPDNMTWELGSESSVTEGSPYQLRIAVNGKLLSYGVSRKLPPVMLTQGTTQAPSKIGLYWVDNRSECVKPSTQLESMYCFGGTVRADDFKVFTPGLDIKIAIPDNYSEHDFKIPDTSQHELVITYKKTLKIPSTPITYIDMDGEGTDGFPFPIRLLPGTWKNPLSGKEEDVIFSLHRGRASGVYKRSIKVLKFVSGSPAQLALNQQQGIYGSSDLDYETPMLPGHYPEWAELLPTIIRGDTQGLLLNRLVNPNYGLRECVGNETLIRDCRARADDNMANHLPPDTRALSGQSVPGGVLLARADASGNLSTTNLQNGMLLMGGNWQAVPTSAPIPMGERIFFAFGKLLQDTDQSLLVTVQNPATRSCSAASLFTGFSIGQAAEVKDSNLKNLLEKQKVEAVTIGALDQDAQPDVVYAGDGFVSILINRGSGKFELSESKITLPAATPVTSIAITDVDKDGKADVIVAQDKSVHIYLNQS